MAEAKTVNKQCPMSCDSLHVKRLFIQIYTVRKNSMYIYTIIQFRDLIPIKQYSTVNKMVTETEGGTKTPLSHNLTGSEPCSEAQWLA